MKTEIAALWDLKRASSQLQVLLCKFKKKNKCLASSAKLFIIGILFYLEKGFLRCTKKKNCDRDGNIFDLILLKVIFN